MLAFRRVIEKGFVAAEVKPGVVRYQNGEQLGYDLQVSFPPYIGGQRYSNLPVDDRGFIHVEPESRRGKDLPDVFAVGDVADYPIKQAFLALLQRDAAADHLAAEIQGKQPSVKFEAMSMCDGRTQQSHLRPGAAQGRRRPDQAGCRRLGGCRSLQGWGVAHMAGG